LRGVGAQKATQPEVKPSTEGEEARHVRPRSESKTGFATVELRFFEEGENLANTETSIDANESEWTEPAAVRKRGGRRRKLATWAALATAGFVAIAAIAVWRTRGNAEPVNPPAKVAAVPQTAAKVSPPTIDPAAIEPAVPRP
jgi:hypothetical protein